MNKINYLSLILITGIGATVQELHDFRTYPFFPRQYLLEKHPVLSKGQIKTIICSFLPNAFAKIIEKINGTDEKFIGVSIGTSAIFATYDEVEGRRIPRIRVVESERDFGPLGNWYKSVATDFSSLADFIDALATNIAGLSQFLADTGLVETSSTGLVGENEIDIDEFSDGDSSDFSAPESREPEEFDYMLKAVIDNYPPKGRLDYKFWRLDNCNFVQIGPDTKNYVLIPLPQGIPFDVAKAVIEGASQDELLYAFRKTSLHKLLDQVGPWIYSLDQLN